MMKMWKDTDFYSKKAIKCFRNKFQIRSMYSECSLKLYQFYFYNTSIPGCTHPRQDMLLLNKKHPYTNQL